MERLLLLLLLSTVIKIDIYAQDLFTLEELALQPLYTYEESPYSKEFALANSLEQINDKEQVYRLIYFDKGPEGKLPFTAKDFPNLQELIIKSCYTSFPKEICGFPKLQVLITKPLFYCESCEVGYLVPLSKDFIRLKHLKILDLGRNSLSLWEEIEQLSELRVLYQSSSGGKPIEIEPQFGPETEENEKSWLLGTGKHLVERNQSLPLSLISMKNLELIVLPFGYKLDEWNLLKQVRPDVRFISTPSEYQEFNLELSEEMYLKDWCMILDSIATPFVPTADGPFVFKHKRVKITGNLYCQQPIGTWEFYSNDKLYQSRNYSADKLVTSQQFDRKGRLTCEYYVHYDTIFNTLYSRYKNGELYREEQFWTSPPYETFIGSDKPYGTFKMYYPDGTLKATVQHLDSGCFSTVYDSKGKLNYTLTKLQFEKNGYKCISITQTDSENNTSTTLYKNGELVNSFDDKVEYWYFYDSIANKSIEEYRDSYGVLLGSVEINYHKGEVSSKTVRRYYKNGQMETEEIYKYPESFECVFNEVRDGIWRRYSENGQLISETEYSMGKIIH